MCRASIEIDGGTEDETGFTMRLAAVVLPDLGTGPDTPIVISHWFAARGDRVWEGERLVEVLVGPATFDVSSPASGRLAEIHGWEDDRVVAGAVLGLVATADDDAHDDGASEPKRRRRRGQSGDEPPSSRPTT
jgi:pyruvate/2-oxoglutarate dehydrogenase complex dihydrolipoamide acyltransferase (E2) component